jgi:outer membrane protein TolC
LYNGYFEMQGKTIHDCPQKKRVGKIEKAVVDVGQIAYTRNRNLLHHELTHLVGLGGVRMFCCKQLWGKLGDLLFLVGCFCVLLAPVGCMTPSRADRETEEVAYRLATVYWQVQTGRTNILDLSRPSEALTLRIALQAIARGDESVVFPVIPDMSVSLTNGVWRLTLAEALNVAARNDRMYQSLKEAIFSAALDLDSRQFMFETTFSGMMLGALSDAMPGSDPRIETATSADFSRRFESGTVMAGSLALDVSRLLSSDWSSLGLAGDLSMTIPLLRGSGREIVREPLTQAERNLVYAIRKFEFYRQTYAVTITDRYFAVLEYVQRLKNAIENEHNLDRNNRRATMMFEAGRMGSIEADQAKSQLLYARESVITMRRSFETRLDSFKMSMGLPPDALVEVDEKELDKLTSEIMQSAKDGTGGDRLFPDEEDACAIALAKRMDLMNTRDTLNDAAREVKVAADMLRADVSVTGRGDTSRSFALNNDAHSDGGESWRFSVRADWPWNRRLERNAYKKKLIALEQTKRDIDEKEDGVKAAIRNGLRSLAAAESSYKIRSETLRVARMRVASTAMFMESGRVIMRDVLEAQNAFITAQNDLCAAIIGWLLRELELRRDMGILNISDVGMWQRSTVMNGKQQ